VPHLLENDMANMSGNNAFKDIFTDVYFLLMDA